MRAVSKSFEGAKRQTTRILDGVSLTAPAGQITTILGESGCGKTTLLRIVAGLETATSGGIHIGEREVTSVHPSRRGVAMVFQNYGLYPAKTVAKNIEFPLKMAGVAPAERRTRGLAAATLLHIDHVMDRMPAQLSGGQRQRVGIARALARDPEILLMDEPLSNLDAQLRIEMRAELVAMQRRIGSTMLYVTHDQTEAMTMSDRVVVMRGGHIEQQGTPEEVFQVPATTYVAAFLGNMNLAPAPASETGAGAGTTLGVRPEHFLPADHSVPQEGDLCIEGAIEYAELLGTDRILHVRAGDTLWRARVDAALPLHERITVRARAANVHRFDAESGVRLAV
ncbi:ABC transporter ATP-binding protein [Mycetocola tolaasinivorans]|uniref:ABC transporter ATP-binding protein n=1 Tax=Mycetocola tolaasinivorans TaxID=76635 RepID=A0A3L7AD15_9MICO|nr:ABC transporter ATP-binding protein [Mycetocola tolaasinivorans]